VDPLLIAVAVRKHIGAGIVARIPASLVNELGLSVRKNLSSEALLEQQPMTYQGVGRHGGQLSAWSRSSPEGGDPPFGHTRSSRTRSDRPQPDF
jgi:hypothetical protein